MLAAMTAMLVAALAIPGAFEGDALLFGCAYLLVRVLHIALFAVGSDDVDVRQATRALAPTALLAPVLVVGASALDGPAQLGLWALALAIDFVGGGLRGIEGWRLSPGHFAERHGLIIIIALGESIVAIGVGASELELTTQVVLAATLGMIVAAALWWTYFDDTGTRVEQHLHNLRGRARNTTARDAYSFLHLPMVAGIVLLALGVKKTLGDVGEPLELVPAVALCGGTGLYLASQVAFRRRCAERGYGQRLIAAGACAALTPLATEASGSVALGALAVVCAALVAYETRPVPPSRRPADSLRGQKAEPERDGPRGESDGAEVDEADQAVGSRRAVACGGKEEAGRHQDRGRRNPVASDETGEAVEVGGVGEQLADERERDEHARVGVSGSVKLLLERGRVLAAARDLQEQESAGLDRDEGEQDDPGGAARVRREREGDELRCGHEFSSFSSGRKRCCATERAMASGSEPSCSGRFPFR